MQPLKPMPLRCLGCLMQLLQREISIGRVPIWKPALRKNLIYKLCTFWWRWRRGAKPLHGCSRPCWMGAVQWICRHGPMMRLHTTHQ